MDVASFAGGVLVASDDVALSCVVDESLCVDDASVVGCVDDASAVVGDDDATVVDASLVDTEEVATGELDAWSPLVVAGVVVDVFDTVGVDDASILSVVCGGVVASSAYANAGAIKNNG